MKFDFAIGNPPYQEEATGAKLSDETVYHHFLDGAYEIADKVEMIHPARFLFNRGKTPKEWNDKILNDIHFKVLEYEQDCKKVFWNTDINGGIAITYYDKDKSYDAVEVFSPYDELRSAKDKVRGSDDFVPITEIVFIQNCFDLEILYKDYPELRSVVGSDGREKRLISSIFKLKDLFLEKRRFADDVEIFGVVNGNRRTSRFVRRKYLQERKDLDCWKVVVPRSNGSGAIGEVSSTPLIGTPFVGAPLVGYTQSFMAFGAFGGKEEAEACLKYIKTKFARVMLGILKITPNNPPETWKYVPLQDFTSASDIDWSESVYKIDLQLHRKYGLDEKEIAFIEEKVKAME